MYKWLNAIQIAAGAALPLIALLFSDYLRVAAVAIGALITVINAFQHMNQHARLWLTYRTTAESLRHEKYLFLSGAGPYRGMEDAERILALAERVEEHVSTEHSAWSSEAHRALAQTGEK